MTRTEEQAELRKLRAAVATAHDHLHQGRVDEAHEALHCGQGDPRPANFTSDAAASLLRFGQRFNELAQQHDLIVAWVALVPSASRPGFVSIQIGGAVPAIQEIRRQMGMAPTRAAGG